MASPALQAHPNVVESGGTPAGPHKSKEEGHRASTLRCWPDRAGAVGANRPARPGAPYPSRMCGFALGC